MSSTANKKERILNYLRSNLVTLILAVVASILLVSNCILYHRVNENKKVYVYNLERVLKLSGAVELKQNFEVETGKLTAEIQTAKDKIQALKDSKLQVEFSDVYLDSLQLKRDNLIENYKKSIEKITEQINVALQKIAVEKNISTVYSDAFIAVRTPWVIDLTSEVLENMQK